LYYRLNVISIQVPPLRERKDEIVPLAEYFVEKHAMPGMRIPAITPSLKDALIGHFWPGNIRELIRKLLVFGDPELIAEELRQKYAKPAPEPPGPEIHAPEAGRVNGNGRSPSSALDIVKEAREQEETKAIIEALDQTHWNRKKAAALLKIAAHTGPRRSGRAPAIPAVRCWCRRRIRPGAERAAL
jgi:two-component system response regulator AtoC